VPVEVRDDFRDGLGFIFEKSMVSQSPLNILLF